MKYLFIDTETTGLPKEYDAPYTDIDNWPRLVQLAWIVYDYTTIVVRKNFIIKPIGFTIPNASTKVHGITTKQALEKGQKVETILKEFLTDAQDADAIIGHNIKFDIKVVQSELYRLSINNRLEQIEVLDTMILSTDYCKIPNKQYEYRFPKLIELYNKLFSESFDNMHDAMADIEATAKCFWALIDRGIINKENYPCLLSSSEKQSLAENYNKQAIEIVWGTRKGSQKEAEALYLKSAKLGNTEGMYKVALYNLGGFVSNRKDYDTALFWLEKIVSLSKKQKVSWYKETLRDLEKIYKDLGNSFMATKYKRLLDEENKRCSNAILANSEKSESDFYKLVLSLNEGINGFSKDKERAIKLMKEGIEKGYRSLYWMYLNYLREQGDEKYFDYLLEDIKDVEKKLEEEYSYMQRSHNKKTADYMYATHKDFWLTKKYRMVAEAYIKGFGTKRDIKEAEKYLRKALGCGRKDYETSFLIARLYNGEFDLSCVNYDVSINQLELLPLKYMDNKYPFALLGDAYIGKSWKKFFKARQCYEKYPDISNYKSTLRKKYCTIRNILNFSIILLVLIFILVLVMSNTK